MEEKQFKYKDIETAIKTATKLSKIHDYVTIIKSNDYYGKLSQANINFYVETEINIIRMWESQIHLWENGKQIF
jgi:hypothetical protein